jgi:hypothetical protein
MRYLHIPFLHSKPPKHPQLVEQNPPKVPEFEGKLYLIKKNYNNPYYNF